MQEKQINDAVEKKTKDVLRKLANGVAQKKSTNNGRVPPTDF